MGEPQLVLQLPRLVTVGLLPFLVCRKEGKLLTTLARGESHEEKGIVSFQKRGSLLGESSGGVRRRLNT